MSEYITVINANGTIAVDDTILVKDQPASGGSKILEGWKPPFSAEAVERLEKAGYEIAGKTNVGEFGLDLLGETSVFGATKAENGTLAGAAAALVAAGKAEGALSVDINGAPRRAAAVSGVDFIKPTYGTVSRYGVMACVCSGEQIGVCAKNAADAAKLLSVIAGHDSKDGTSLPAEKYEYDLTKPVGGMKIAVVKELLDAAESDSADAVNSYVERLKALGAEVEVVSIKEVCAAQAAWQILSAAETCNNVSRYDGVKYGYRTENYNNIDELYVNTRTEGFGFLTKATILYGSDVLSKNRYDGCYDKALRIRRVMKNRFNEIFADYAAVIAPACSTLSFEEYDSAEAFDKVYGESLFTAPASIVGLPAMVTKGVQLIADSLNDSVLFSIANSVECKEG